MNASVDFGRVRCQAARLTGASPVWAMDMNQLQHAVGSLQAWNKSQEKTTGNGADASGNGSFNVATGGAANASGNNSTNVATGYQANASGASSANTATGNKRHR